MFRLVHVQYVMKGGIHEEYKQRGGRGDAFFVASRAAGPAIIIMR